MFLTLLTFLGLGISPSTLFTEKIEARIGKQIITSTDLRLASEQLQQRAREEKSDQTLRKAALDRLIEQALIKEYLSSIQMDVSEQEVDRRINSIRTSQGVESLDDFRKFIEAQGLSFAAFKKQVREQMELAQFQQVLQRQSLQTIDENELKAFYNSHLADFKSNYEIELQECIIPFGEQKDKIVERANYYQKNPKKFDECVTKFSQGPSVSNKGNLGSFRMGSLREEVEAQVFSISKNEVAVINLPGAIQLLKVTNKKDLGPQSFESVKDKIRSQLESERLVKARQKLLSELKASTFIKVES